MESKRLSLVHYEVAREVCMACDEETFQFLPIGQELESSSCNRCGRPQTEVDLSETSLSRLVTRGSSRLKVTREEDRRLPN